MIKRFFVAIIACTSINAFSISIPITESIVNVYVSESFPKTVKKIELSNPQITLIEGKSIICLEGIPKIMFLYNKFKTCSSFKPVWNKKESRLEATQFEIINLTIKDIGSVPSALRVIMNEVLIGVEPLILYKADQWFLKQVNSIEINKGILYLKY